MDPIFVINMEFRNCFLTFDFNISLLPLYAGIWLFALSLKSIIQTIFVDLDTQVIVKQIIQGAEGASRNVRPPLGAWQDAS